MSPRLAFALKAAHAAGRFTLAHFQAGAEVELKADDTPVTVADKGAERLIRDAIAREYPTDTILGEEEGQTGESDDRWVVDPIDGTKSFISGVPLYATLLSYEVAGKPILGVCYFPALDELFYAEVGSGAFLNGRPIHVSDRSTVEGSVLACGGHSTMLKQGRMEPFLRLAEKALATRTWGDAYGHALVAAGRIDAMIDPLVARWDVSPMQLIVTEAGGRFSDFAGNDGLAPGLHGAAISSNGRIHPHLLEAFRPEVSR